MRQESEASGMLQRYGRILDDVDAWFGRCRASFPEAIACGSGCSGCCRGLFDITLLDAFLLASGFNKLPPEMREPVRAKACSRMVELRSIWHDFQEPYVLNVRPEEDWEELLPDGDETPCVLLDDAGRCLLYAYRPMTCRLHGIPLVDVGGDILHDEWCTRNFSGSDPLHLPELRGDLKRILTTETKLIRRLNRHLLKRPIDELDTLIPAALLLDFEAFTWSSWIESVNLVENAPVD